MFCSFHILALFNFFVYATSEQLSLQKGGNSTSRSDDNSGVLCSETGNCTCLFEEFDVIVKCTHAGDKLEKFASELPKTTTHL